MFWKVESYDIFIEYYKKEIEKKKIMQAWNVHNNINI